MAAPNIEGTTNPAVLTGGDAGSIVGETTSETVGFYGNTGVAQQSSSGVTTVAGVVQLLKNLGLVS